MLKSIPWKAIIYMCITFVSFQNTHGAIIPLKTTTIEPADIYPSYPNEILHIQPLLIYPKPRKHLHKGRNLDKDDEIIYVKLLKTKSYHPKHKKDEDIPPSRELTIKDIFYVKALANGQFSPRRLKVFRLPEFFAISVFHKGEDN